AQRAPGLHCLPAELIRISGLNHVRAFLFQNFSDGAQIQQRAILCRARHKRRTNRVNARAAVCFQLRLWAWNNQNVLVARRMLLDVIDLLVKITFPPSAYRRIKLIKIADLHGIADCRLLIADFREAAMIAISSPASVSSGRILASVSNAES